MTLSDLERRNARSQIVSDGSSVNYARMVRPWTKIKVRPILTKFRMVTHVVDKQRVSKGSATLPFPRGGPQRSQRFGTPTYAQTVCRRAMKFVTITRVGEWRVSVGSVKSLAKGAVSQRPQNFCYLHACTEYDETTNKF